MPSNILVDEDTQDLEPGSLDELNQSLDAMITEQAKIDAGGSVDEPADDSASNVERPDWIQEKYWTGDLNESVEKQAKALPHLQTSYGRLTNELGEQRRMTDQLLNMQPGHGQAPKEEEPITIDSDELLDNPQRAMDDYFDRRLKRFEEQQAQRLSSMEAEVQQREFIRKHPDYESVAQSPEFLEWVQASPLRVRAYQGAARDFNVADELLTEFKFTNANTQTTEAKPPVDKEAEALEKARNVGLESTINDESASKGPILKRVDIMRLSATDREKYESEPVQRAIIQAYKDGRVR